MVEKRGGGVKGERIINMRVGKWRRLVFSNDQSTARPSAGMVGFTRAMAVELAHYGIESTLSGRHSSTARLQDACSKTNRSLTTCSIEFLSVALAPWRKSPLLLFSLLQTEQIS